MEEFSNDPQQSPMSEELALLAALQQDIAARLRPICSEMDEATFDQLVRDIAAMKLKYGAESDLSGSLRNELHSILASGNESST
jgi:hypothetical protein